MSIELPPLEQLGPKMRGLRSNGHRRFVIALSQQLTGYNWTNAYAEAYGRPGDHTSRQEGYMLSRRDDIRAALHEESERLLHSGKMLGIKALMSMVADPLHKDHFKATQAFLNRVGFHEVHEQKIDVTHTHRTDDEKLKRIEALAKMLGRDPAEFIRSLPAPTERPLPAPVDAEFVEVSSEGLEDLL